MSLRGLSTFEGPVMEEQCQKMILRRNIQRDRRISGRLCCHGSSEKRHSSRRRDQKLFRYLSKKCVKPKEDHLKTPRRHKSKLEQVERHPLFLDRMIQHHR